MPLILQQDNRKAVIDGDRVSLLRLRNKRKPTGVWPEQIIPDETERMHMAVAWVVMGFIDFP